MTERSEGISEVIPRKRDRLYGFIRRRVPDRRDAEDILQDVFFEFARACSLPERPCRNDDTDVSKGNSFTKTKETLENGAIHSGVPGKDGPMDVRIMDGQAKGGGFNGPRVRTTRNGSANDGVRSDGSKFRNNESKEERLRDSHTHLDLPRGDGV